MKKITMSTVLTNRETDSFKHYLKKVSEIKLLSPLEEKTLSKKMCEGDEEARNKLVEHNLRFVISVAKKYTTDNVPLEDLVEEGNIGLIIAANKFDYTKGYKFISFAVWWIQKIILEFLTKHAKTVRIPSNKVNGISRLEKKVNQLEQKFGRVIDIQEVINEFGDGSCDGDDYKQLNILSSFNVSSLDRELDSEFESSMTGLEMLCDDEQLTTDNLLVKEDISYEIRRALKMLSPRNKEIMVSLYGLDGKVPQTLEMLSLKYDVSQERIRQIKIKSLNLMKKKMDSSSMLEYI